MRIAASLWVAIVLISRCNSSTHPDSAKISPAKVEKLKTISEKYQGSLNKNDIITLGAEIAKEFSDDADKTATDRSPLLAIAFTAPAGDAAAAKLADCNVPLRHGEYARRPSAAIRRGDIRNFGAAARNHSVTGSA